MYEIRTMQVTSAAAAVQRSESSSSGRADVDGVNPGSENAEPTNPEPTNPEAATPSALPDKFSSKPYVPKLSLAQIGSPYLSAGGGAFGSFVRAGISLAFGDMLGQQELD